MMILPAHEVRQIFQKKRSVKPGLNKENFVGIGLGQRRQKHKETPSRKGLLIKRHG